MYLYKSPSVRKCHEKLSPCQFLDAFYGQMDQERKTEPSAQKRRPVLSKPTVGTEADVHKETTVALALSAAQRNGRKESTTRSAITPPPPPPPPSFEHTDGGRDKEQTSAETDVFCVKDVLSTAPLYPPNACPPLSSVLEAGGGSRTLT